MRAFHDEIVRNTIAYVAMRYKALTGKNPIQVLMYKILALFDFQCVKELGRSCTELAYYAEQHGPVPHELKDWKDELVSKDSIRLDGRDAKVFVCHGKPDTNYLSDFELELLDSIIQRAVDEKWDASKASAISHDEIKAWSIGRDRPRHEMLYTDEFDDLAHKDFDSMTSAEQNFSLYSAVEKLSHA